MADHIDPDFARRVAEYQRKARSGFAFQAEGTVGGKRGRPMRAAWRARPFHSLFKLLALLLALKVSTYHLAQTLDILPKPPVNPAQISLAQKAKLLLLYPDSASVNFSWFMVMLQSQIGLEFRNILKMDVTKALE